MALKTWRQTAAENTSIGTINWNEGQAPSTVNDSARAMMADIATQYEPATWGWVAISATASLVSASSPHRFKVSTDDLTSDFVANRGVKLTGGSAGANTTLFGHVLSSSYTSETTVTLDGTSGSLSASHQTVWLSAVEPNTLPSNVVTGSGTSTFTSAVVFQESASFSASVHFAGVVNLKESVSFSATVQFNDAMTVSPYIKDYAEVVNAEGGGGGTIDLDVSKGNVITATVDTSTTTFTFSNPSATGRACSFTLILTNGGSQTVNWPASVDWAGGSGPTLTTSGIDILEFFTIDAGTIWYGFSAGLDMQ